MAKGWKAEQFHRYITALVSFFCWGLENNGSISKGLITTIVRKSLLSRVVGPLPTGLFMAYKWKVFTVLGTTRFFVQIWPCSKGTWITWPQDWHWGDGPDVLHLVSIEGLYSCIPNTLAVFVDSWHRRWTLVLSYIGWLCAITSHEKEIPHALISWFMLRLRLVLFHEVPVFILFVLGLLVSDCRGLCPAPSAYTHKTSQSLRMSSLGIMKVASGSWLHRGSLWSNFLLGSMIGNIAHGQGALGKPRTRQNYRRKRWMSLEDEVVGFYYSSFLQRNLGNIWKYTYHRPYWLGIFTATYI